MGWDAERLARLSVKSLRGAAKPVYLLRIVHNCLDGNLSTWQMVSSFHGFQW